MARVVEVVVWWAAAVGVWLLTLSSVTVPDLMVAAACGLPTAVAARAGRRAIGGRWRPRAAWLRWFLLLPGSVVTDTARVFGTALHRSDTRRGQVRRVELPGEGPEPVAAARRALATLALSATPGTFVIESDPEAHRLLVHSLSGGTTLLEKAVSR